MMMARMIPKSQRKHHPQKIWISCCMQCLTGRSIQSNHVPNSNKQKCGAEFPQVPATRQISETLPQSQASSILEDAPRADIALDPDKADHIYSKLRFLLVFSPSSLYRWEGLATIIVSFLPRFSPKIYEGAKRAYSNFHFIGRRVEFCKLLV